MLNSSPEGDDSLPSDDSEVVRPSTASLGDSSWTRRNWPCMGWLWKLLRYGSTRSAWNSRPPSLKPRKTPTISSSGKSSSVGIGLPLPVAPLRRVRVLEAERVERVGVRAENLSDALEDLVLQDVEVEIDQRGVVVGALEAARVQRNGEAVLCVTKQVAQDGGRVLPLGQEDVDRPDGVARSVAELDEEHLAADEFVDLAALVLAVVPADEHEQHRPLDEFSVDVHPARAHRTVAIVAPDHVAQRGDVPHTEVRHQLAELRPRFTAVLELPRAQVADARGRRDRLQAVL